MADDPRLGAKPPNVDDADWQQLQTAFASVTSPGYGIRPQDPNPTLGNDPKLEENWAITAGKHAETYMKLLRSFKDKRTLRLTPIDSAIHQHFRSTFPTLNISVLSDHSLKSRAAKLQWRQFCNSYSDNPTVKDFNFGCLLRLDARADYDDADNVTIGESLNSSFTLLPVLATD